MRLLTQDIPALPFLVDKSGGRRRWTVRRVDKSGGRGHWSPPVSHGARCGRCRVTTEVRGLGYAQDFSTIGAVTRAPVAAPSGRRLVYRSASVGPLGDCERNVIRLELLHRLRPEAESFDAWREFSLATFGVLIEPLMRGPAGFKAHVKARLKGALALFRYQTDGTAPGPRPLADRAANMERLHDSP